MVPAAAPHRRSSVGDRRGGGGDLVLRRRGQFNYGQSLKLQWGVHRPTAHSSPRARSAIDVIAQKVWRNLRFPLKWAPPEANVARIVADDPNLSTDQWFGFTPPRVPVLETAQQFLGSRTPILMDLSTAANFPCQRPFSEHLWRGGTPGIPDPAEPQTGGHLVEHGQSARAGGPFLFIQALLTTATIPTYLRDDWYHRDWGHRAGTSGGARHRCPDAVIETGSRTAFGWSRSGPIRALP